MKNENYEYVTKILFDAADRQPLTLKNAAGARMDFEQIFALQKDGRLYCILRPLACIEGLGVHAALVFCVDENGVFRAVREKQLSEDVFAEYYDALQRRQKKEG